MKIKVLRFLFAMFLTILWHQSVSQKSDKDVTGIWQTRKNNVYMEMIISPKTLRSAKRKSGNNLWISNMSFAYSKDDLLDAALFNSRMKNDSLLLFDGATPLTPWKAIVPNDHELYLTLDTIKFRLTRILEKDAMVEILKIDTVKWTDPHFKNYIDGYLRRRDHNSK